MKKFFGIKKNQTRVYLEDGRQLPITVVAAEPLVALQVKTQEKDGYQAVQFGLGQKRIKLTNKPTLGHLKRAGLKAAPLHVREVEFEGEIKPGDQVTVDQVLKEGMKVQVAGTSKGRGFTGVMKRWNFAGGPRTHGQSDRPRSPGSIGQGTTPGRVYPGKKMAGHSGDARVTVKNLTIVKVDPEKNEVWVKGQLPGKPGGLIEITILGEDKRHAKVLAEGGALNIEAAAEAKKEAQASVAKKEEAPAEGETTPQASQAGGQAENKSEGKSEAPAADPTSGGE